MHSLSLLLLSFCLPLPTLEATDWCYDVQNTSCGPNTWRIGYPTCGMLKQSPINIVTADAKLDTRLVPIVFEGYDKPNTTEMWIVENDGHTLRMALKGNIRIKGGNLPNTFKAVEFHFHWGSESSAGSEHLINGHQYPMEMHIVHQNEKYSSLTNALKHSDGVAVLGFLFSETPAENVNIRHLINFLKMIKSSGNNASVTPFALSKIIPDKTKLTKYYRYEGSLTNPGCNEAVIWTVFSESIPFNKKQRNEFSTSLLFGDLKSMNLNFRPVQKLNDRAVYVSSVRLFNAAWLSVTLPVLTSIYFRNM
ncbi:carbonic anhydrase 4-like [Stegostoma tigrinum]|uniref:carbonic anhydrase 4-like n=1 Tax=Stegostoma tigrinum TaxID=3053191 RepID=UPI0028701B7C|nr:carbonic anhydrase 4-like [Stegostoma tigrinum]